jgi:hypothetical protein
VDLQSGLIASYPFNGNANDGSGNGNNGTFNTVSGTEIFSSDRFNNTVSSASFQQSSYVHSVSLSLPGGNGYYNVNNTLGNFRLNDFSISAWVQITNTTTPSIIVCKRQHDFSGNQFEVGVFSNKIYFAMSNGTLPYSPAQNDSLTVFSNPIQQNQWINVVVIRKNNIVYLYVNGVLNATSPYRPIDINNTYQFLIGASKPVTGVYFDVYGIFNGQIDEVNVFNRALTDCEISQLYSTTITTVGSIVSYPFCGNANDVTGNGNNGTVVGASLTTDRFGNLNSAYTFGGNSISPNYITCGASPSLKMSGNKISVSAWIKITGDGYNYGRIVLGGQVNTQYTLTKADLSDDRIYWRPIDFGDVYTTSSVTRNIWHHIIATYDGSTSKIYLNGVLSNTTTVTGTFTANTKDFVIGGETISHGGGTRASYFDGAIDDIKIYNKVLSNSEILALYNEASACCTTITTVSISGPSIISNCSATSFLAVSNVSGSYNWATQSGVISNHTSATISVNWITPGVYPLSVTVFNGCSTITSTINVTVTSTVTVTSISKPIIGRNNDNLIVNNSISGINYQWLLNSANEPGQNSYIHTASLEQSTYQVRASSLADCATVLSDPRDVLPIMVVVTVTNFEIQCVTIIENFQKNSVEIYPNPGSGLFNLRTENIVIGKIEVFNSQGQMVYNKLFNHAIDLTNQPAGIYLMRLYDQSGILAKTSRIIIE